MMGKYTFPHSGVEPINCFFRKYEERTHCSKSAGSFFIALTRDGETVYREELRLVKDDPETEKYLWLFIKSIMWIFGGDTLYGEGEDWTCELFESDLSFDGKLSYELNFFNSLYAKEFSFVRGRPQDIQTEHISIATSEQGLRVGLDLGASSIKAVLVNNGSLLKSDIIEWTPSEATHGDYILDKVITAVDCVCPGRNFISLGISTAGIISNNEIISSSLYRSLTEKLPLVKLLGDIFGTPVMAVNDGDAAALAAGDKGTLAFALGSDLGGGYITEKGKITGNLNELAFVPMDVGRAAPQCEWSKHYGTGGVFLSKRGRDYFDKNGIDWEDYAESMGYLIGHSIPWFTRFYSFSCLALYGGIASDKWGQLMINSASEVLKSDYPELLENVTLMKAKGQNERFQQAIAAAKLELETRI